MGAFILMKQRANREIVSQSQGMAWSQRGYNFTLSTAVWGVTMTCYSGVRLPIQSLAGRDFLLINTH
jgi:hypothetical protein